jgi:hypothetical protein
VKPSCVSPRNGTVLIIVAGISALLAAMALTFLAQMRSDVEESQLVLQHAQAKLMLAAGCNYIQESSRVGWDRSKDPSPPPIPTVDGLRIHEEAFGWVDVRTGKTGPLNRAGESLMGSDTTKWPHIGTFVRCPMFLRRIPPYATSLATGFNPILTKDPSSPEYGYPLMRYPDPQPLDQLNSYDHASPGSVTDARYEEFVKGDPTPRTETMGRAWFRVFRDGPATFIITCGSGATLGYKDWSEIPASDRPQFQSEEFFNHLRFSELRLHYRVEWTAAGVETSYHNLQHEIARTHDHYESWPPNASHAWSSSRRTQTWLKSPVGTIRWIQRLVMEPKFW